MFPVSRRMFKVVCKAAGESMHGNVMRPWEDERVRRGVLMGVVVKRDGVAIVGWVGAVV